MLDLVSILKDCPMGTTLYSPITGGLVLDEIIENSAFPILTRSKHAGDYHSFTSDGRYFDGVNDAECILFPSKDCRDWAQFKQQKKSEFKKGDHILWHNTSDNCIFGVFDKYTDEGQCVINLFDGDHLKSTDVYIKDLTKVEKFDTKWLNTGDNVLVRDRVYGSIWSYSHFSHIAFEEGTPYFIASCTSWQTCVPFNYETKHLVGSQEDAPEFYQQTTQL